MCLSRYCFRIIRKPSKPPPLPPPALLKPKKEIPRYQSVEDVLEDQTKSSIRCLLADGTEVPKLPLISPPSPPRVPTNDDDEQFDGLYEEIEYEFSVKSGQEKKKSFERFV
jgi:hypothetical protein